MCLCRVFHRDDIKESQPCEGQDLAKWTKRRIAATSNNKRIILDLIFTDKAPGLERKESSPHCAGYIARKVSQDDLIASIGSDQDVLAVPFESHLIAYREWSKKRMERLA